MKCAKCGVAISDSEKMELHGNPICEDCYIDAVSPPRTCDPWAVHTAKSCLASSAGAGPEQNDIQLKILQMLEEKGQCAPGELATMLDLKPSELEREIAALRHMEKIRGKLVDGNKFIILW